MFFGIPSYINIKSPDVTITYNCVASEDNVPFSHYHYNEILSNQKDNKWLWCNITMTVTWKGLQHTEVVPNCCFSSEADFKDSRGKFSYSGILYDCLVHIDRKAKEITKVVTKHLVPTLIDAMCRVDSF